MLLLGPGQGVDDEPDGTRWEVYTVLGETPVESGLAGYGNCCTARVADSFR